jgi:hypothetical protein
MNKRRAKRKARLARRAARKPYSCLLTDDGFGQAFTGAGALGFLAPLFADRGS